MRKSTKQIAGLLLAYSGMLFLATYAGLSDAQHWFFVIIAMAWVAASIQLCSMWAVLGPGVYWRRAIISLIAGIGVAAGGLLGGFLSGDFASVTTARAVIGVGLAMGPMLWMLCQAPFLLARYVLGWHLAPANAPHLEPTRISDMFAFMTLAACAFAGLQAVHWPEQAGAPEGAIFSTLGVATVALLLINISLSVPALVCVYFSSEASTGCTKYVIYLLVVITVLALSLIVISSGRVRPEGVAAVLVFVSSYGFAFCLPLMFNAESGFVLWTKARCVEWLSRSEADRATSDSWPVEGEDVLPG